MKWDILYIWIYYIYGQVEAKPLKNHQKQWCLGEKLLLSHCYEKMVKVNPTIWHWKVLANCQLFSLGHDCGKSAAPLLLAKLLRLHPRNVFAAPKVAECLGPPFAYLGGHGNVMVNLVVVLSYLHPLLPPLHSSSVHIKLDHNSSPFVKSFHFHGGHVKDIVVIVVCPIEDRIPCEVVAFFVAEEGGVNIATGRIHRHLEAVVAMWMRQ